MALNLPKIKTLFKQSANDGDTGIFINGKIGPQGINTLFIPACAFVSYNAVAEPIQFEEGYLVTTQNGTALKCPVQLPYGCKIKSCIVYGDDTTKTWTLEKWGSDNTWSEILLSHTIGSQDTTINEGTGIIDNSNGSYIIKVMNVATGKLIFGAKIVFSFE